MKKFFHIFLAVTLIAVFGVPIAHADLFVSSSEGKIYRYNGVSALSEIEAINDLTNPTRLAFGPDGNLYVIDENNNEIRRYEGKTYLPMGVFVSGNSEDYPEGSVCPPVEPTSLTFDQNYLYVLSSGTGQVLRYDSNGQCYGINGNLDGVFASGTELDGVPADMVFSPEGKLYVTNPDQNKIVRVDIDNDPEEGDIATIVTFINGAGTNVSAIDFGNDINGVDGTSDLFLYLNPSLGNPDENSERIDVYDGETGDKIETFIDPIRIGDFVVHTEGNIYATLTNNRSIQPFDGNTGEALEELDTLLPGQDVPIGIAFDECGLDATNIYYLDADGDGYGNPLVSQKACTPPNEYVADNTDCDDDDPNEHPNQTWYKDADGDDYSDGTTDTTSCTRPTNYYTASELEDKISGDCDDNDASVNPEATEVCDNVDNNCNGEVDEDLTRVTTCGVGECSGNTGIETCTDGSWDGDTCNPLEGATAETCDGLDNDCDGTADDGIASVPTTCGTGECASTGTESCVDGELVDNCTPGTPASTETCDGLDNTCDGQIDEGIASEPTTCGTGECASTGEIACVDGESVDSCTAGTPSDETCDGLDNDCDGTADDGIASVPTTCGTGECASTGEIACVDGESVDSCTAGTPSDETCDGLDNDCDGQIDDEDLDGDDLQVCDDLDDDNDGILDDGDNSGDENDNPCTGGNTENCDDNCQINFNPLQGDLDGDLIGDECDDCDNDPDNDVDEDGVCGDVDNCPFDANPNQVDADEDGVGAACDSNDGDPEFCGDFDEDTCEDCFNGSYDPANDGLDTDLDGICDNGDNCPADDNPGQEDIDADGVGDACENCPDDPDKTEPGECGCGVTESDADSDGNGIPNCIDRNPPDTPIVDSPEDGSSFDDDESIPLDGGPFSDPDEDSHYFTHWQVWRADKPYDPDDLEYEAKIEIDGVDLTQHSIPEGELAPGLKYSWKMGYEDSKGDIAWSENHTFIVGAATTDIIPPMSPGTDLADFTMTSFVQYPDDPTATNVFGITCDPENYKIGTYDPFTEEYIDCNSGLEIEPGKAYWILARTVDDFSASYSGIPVSLLTDIHVSLSYNEDTDNGWNQIGCPNAANYYWNDLEVIEYDADGEIVFGPTAISNLPADNEYIDVRIWDWESGSYVAYEPGDNFLMETHEGYWVRAKKANVHLKFPESVQASISNLNAMLASYVSNGQRWLEKWVFSPSVAIADSGVSPPLPMASLGTSGSGTITGSGSSCFIATAAFGSSMAPHVGILREFRNRFLLTNEIGKTFVDFYYKYSPPLADFIAKHANLRAIVRVSLLPIVGMSWFVLKIGPVSTISLMLFFACGLIGLVRVRNKFGNKD